MKVIVGLGNPESKYRNTRHNVGFHVLDLIAERIGASFDREKYDAAIAKAQHKTESVLLMKPLTYMNRSGISVAKATRNTIDAFDSMLVIVDDVNLPLGRLRIRTEGSAGGHNGLKSIIEHVGTERFPRLRIGVGGSSADRDLSDHVLSKFKPDERADFETMVERAADAALVFVTQGIECAMNEFNPPQG